MKVILEQINSQEKCQVTVYTKSMGDIPLNQNSVHDGFALR